MEPKTETKEKEKNKNNSFFSRLKNIKNIELIVGVIILCVILLVFLNGNSESKNVSTGFSNEEYTLNLEKKLCLLLGDITGAGKVSAMITLESGIEYVPLTNKELAEGVTSDGDKVLKEEIIMVNGKPFILKEKYPKIAGVVIVCTGGDNIKTKLEILRATTALLNVDKDNIEILTRK